MSTWVSDEAWAAAGDGVVRLSTRERIGVCAVGLVLLAVVTLMLIGRATGFTTLKLGIVPSVLTSHRASHTITVSYRITNDGSTADRITTVVPNMAALTVAPGGALPVTVEAHTSRTVVVQLAVDCRASRSSTFALRFDVERGPWTLSKNVAWDAGVSAVREVCHGG